MNSIGFDNNFYEKCSNLTIRKRVRNPFRYYIYLSFLSEKVFGINFTDAIFGKKTKVK